MSRHLHPRCRRNRSVGRLAALLCLLAACSPATSHPEPDELPAGRVPGVPACRASIDEVGLIRVAGQSIGLDVDLDVPFPAEPRAATWPLDGDRVLVAAEMVAETHPMDGRSGVLWEVSCTGAAPKKVFFRQEGADFVRAAYSRSRRVLYYSGLNALMELDLATGKARSITTPEPLDVDECWGAAGEDDPGLTSDVVIGLDGETRLRFYRGGPCGFEADWQQHEMALIDVQDPAARRLHRPRQVATVAIDGGGTLWLGDAGRCREPGTRDPQSPGVVWRSRDEGATWEKVRIADADDPIARMDTAASVIVADSRKAGALVVLAARCSNEARGGYGAGLWLTRDGGESWRPLPLPADVRAAVEDEADAGAQVPVGLGLKRGSLGGLILHTRAGETWTTGDLGATWRVDDEAGRKPTDTRAARSAEFVFLATPDGLLRRPLDGGDPIRVFPPRAR